MAALAEAAVAAQMLDVAHMQAADAVHLAEVANHRRDIVLHVAAQRARAQAERVAGAVVQLHHAVKARLIVRDARQAEDRPARIVRMAGHLHADLFAGRDDAVEEILEVFKQLLLVHALVELQHVLQLGQTGGLPARQGEAVGVFGRAADDLHRGHRAQLGLIVIQAVGAVLRDDARQIGAQPVQHRHEVVDDDLHAVLRQIADGLAVILDVLVARGQAELDILMHVDALDDLALEPRGMHLVDIRLDLVFLPNLARGLVVKHAHQAGAAGDLLDLLERDFVALTAIPAKRHFHVLPFSFRFVWSHGATPCCLLVF